MEDNPRLPEQHSDMPSSRPSERPGNPGGPPYGYHTPPPQDTGTPNRKHYKNLVLGALVTIITSTIVFIITQYLKKPEGSEFQRKKEATTAAWKSYVGYENAYTQNTLSYKQQAEADGMDVYLAGVTNESAKFLNDIKSLLKRKHLDEDFINTLNKRVDNEKNSLQMVSEYFTNIKKIDSSNEPIAVKKEKLTAEMLRQSRITKGLYERAINDIGEIAKVLSDRYGGSFNINDFLVIQLMPQMMKSNDSLIQVLQNVILDSNGVVIENRNFAVNVNPDNLVGKWNTPGAVISFSKDGKMSWLVNDGTKAEGTWKIINDQLEIEATTSASKKKTHWRFNLAQIKTNSFTMILDASPYNIYNMTRTVDN